MQYVMIKYRSDISLQYFVSALAYNIFTVKADTVGLNILILIGIDGTKLILSGEKRLS